jgi:hypothetical protein
LVGSLLAIASASGAAAQATDQAPAAHPDHPLIDVHSNAPHISPGDPGRITILLELKSLTGRPAPIATESLNEGWSLFSATGASCPNGVFNVMNIIWLGSDGRLQGDADPAAHTAGVSRAALVPVSVYCPNIHRGDEVSYTAKFVVLVGNTWVTQEFSWQEVPVK